MALVTGKELCVLSMGAAAAVAMGIAMHAEHAQMQQTCEMEWGDTVDVDALDPAPQPVVPSVAPSAEVAPTTPLVYGPAFSFVVELPDGPHLVLSTDVDPRWVGGEPRAVDPEHVEVPLAEDALEPQLRGRTDRTVMLYGRHGALGTGRVGAPRLVAAGYGDLTVALPDAEYDAYHEAWNRGEQPPLPPTLVWDEGRRLLVAPIETTVPPTAGVLWARDADAATPTILIPADEMDSAAARDHLLMHPAAASLASDMTYFDADDHSESSIVDRVVTRRWLGLEGRTRAATAWFDGPEFEPCGGLSGMAWAMTAGDDETATPLPYADDMHAYGPTAIFDLDRDGWLDVLVTSDYVSGDTTLLAGGPTGWRTVATLPEVPFYGCPC